MSYKLDGLTIVLRYNNGKFTQAITRGREGLIGEDVTHTVRKMLNVPLVIECKEPIEVRGEGVVSWANFEKLNKTLVEPYSHPRNLASGAVRKLDAELIAERRLEFLAFDLVSESESTESKLSQLQFLESNGFDVVQYMYLMPASSDGAVKAVLKAFTPEDCSYPVDGLIVEYDDRAYAKSLGATGHHTNGLIALKWQDELFETTFLGVELAVTRTGMVSVTGKFEDVEMDGAVVNRAYLHNLDIYENFKLGAGDKVRLFKANQIIPQLYDNLTGSGTYELCVCAYSGSDKPAYYASYMRRSA